MHLGVESASFENSYKLKIDKQDVFVDVFAEPLSTNFKITDKLPSDFTQKYHPAHTY